MLSVPNPVALQVAAQQVSPGAQATSVGLHTAGTVLVDAIVDVVEVLEVGVAVVLGVELGVGVSVRLEEDGSEVDVAEVLGAGVVVDSDVELGIGVFVELEEDSEVGEEHDALKGKEMARDDDATVQSPKPG